MFSVSCIRDLVQAWETSAAQSTRFSDARRCSQADERGAGIATWGYM